MRNFAGSVALVTGGTKGIGRSIALALAAAGTRVYATGTDQAALDSLRGGPFGGQMLPVRADLAVVADIDRLVSTVRDPPGRLDILVHCAGRFQSGSLCDASVSVFDELQSINARAPLILTRELIPALVASRGDLVFVNSSLGIHGRRGASQYAASKHALRAIADSVREEVNGLGVRVLSLYLGRTATPMQEAIHRTESRRYDPDQLLQPDSVAEILMAALRLPDTAEVTDLHVRPRYKSN